MIELYKPIKFENIKIDGFSVGTIPAGETGNILVRAFITSDEARFHVFTKNLLTNFININELDAVNRLLIIIDKNDTASVYKVFPQNVGMKAKKDLKKGQVVFWDDIADITEIHFEDSVFNVPILDGDKIVWLFRHRMKFYLYFDFSRKNTVQFSKQEMGYYFKKVIFADLYNFTADHNNFNKLLVDGWFPFLRLVGSKFDKLIQYYDSDQKYNESITQILMSFSKDEINQFVLNWWRNPYFKAKKTLIEAGLNAYYLDSDEGYILCIKTLMSEIEGILRLAIFTEQTNNNPSTANLKDFIVNKALTKFTSLERLGFPHKFKDYLDSVLFKGFDIADTDVPTSRHSVNHGVARIENYSKVRALQLILLLDQLTYFL